MILRRCSQNRTWESFGKDRKNEEKEYVDNSRHDVRLSGLPSLKD
jgi:hypothetical protein